MKAIETDGFIFTKSGVEVTVMDSGLEYTHFSFRSPVKELYKTREGVVVECEHGCDIIVTGPTLNMLYTYCNSIGH